MKLVIRQTIAILMSACVFAQTAAASGVPTPSNSVTVSAFAPKSFQAEALANRLASFAHLPRSNKTAERVWTDAANLKDRELPPVPQWVPPTLSDFDLADGKRYHRGLYLNGNIHTPVTWHRDNMAPLIAEALDYIQDGDIVVDYATGTGGSAIELLKALDARGIRIKLICVDALESWFAEAYHQIHAMGHGDDVEFYLMFDKTTKTWRTLPEILHGWKARLVLSANTLHLIPEKALPGAFQGAASILEDKGAFLFNTGDIAPDPQSDSRQTVLLHDPYRRMRQAALREIPETLAAMPEAARLKYEKVANQIFLPVPHTYETFMSALGTANLVGRTTSRVISVNDVDSLEFIRVPRLQGYVPEIVNTNERETLIIRMMITEVLPHLPRDPQNARAYLTYWTFGSYIKPINGLHRLWLHLYFALRGFGRGHARQEHHVEQTSENSANSLVQTAA